MAEVDVELIRDRYRISDTLRSRYKATIVNNKCKCVLGTHVDDNPSMSIFKHKNTRQDHFKCQSCGAHGDVLELVMQVEGVDLREAAKRLANGQEIERSRAPVLAPAKPAVSKIPFAPFIPADAKLPQVGVNFSAVDRQGNMTKPAKPELVHVYRDEQGRKIAVVCRFKMGDSKACKPLRWANDAWIWAGFTIEDGERPPVYNRDELEMRPQAEVLVCEGEKSVDAARAAFPDLVVVGWLGGTSTCDKVDWSCLRGRSVIVWEDNDEPGRTIGKIIKERGLPGRYRLFQLPEPRPAKWDVYDELQRALERDRTPRDVYEWMMGSLLETVPAAVRRQHTRGMQLKVEEWLPETEQLVYTATGALKQSSQLNAYTVLKHHPDFHNRFSYDVFDHEALSDGKPISATTIHEIQRDIFMAARIEPAIDTLRPMVHALAQQNNCNRFVTALLGLEWDGRHRLTPSPTGRHRGLLVEYCDVEDNAFTRMAGARWMYGLIRRLVEDKWRHDYLLVLEGAQGARKTTFFQTLARPMGFDLYTELSGSGIARGDKDDLMKLKGRAIIELSEMTAHRKADVDAFKSFLDRQVDHYRPPYASETQEFPRRCVFAGTTNPKGQYLTDSTGNRRIWPAYTNGKIQIERLEDDVNQIWAEALHFALLKEDGIYLEKNYLNPEELAIQEARVEDRSTEDPWTQAVKNLLASVEDPEEVHKEMLWMAIPDLEMKHRGPREAARLGEIMEKLGYRYGQGPYGQGGRRWRLRKK